MAERSVLMLSCHAPECRLLLEAQIHPKPTIKPPTPLSTERDCPEMMPTALPLMDTPTGEGVSALACDSRCLLHGNCNSNGTCACQHGWNGKYCTLDGCPMDCHGNGDCSLGPDGWWGCHCHRGWEGEHCSIVSELNCDDGIDNDHGKNLLRK